MTCSINRVVDVDILGILVFHAACEHGTAKARSWNAPIRTSEVLGLVPARYMQKSHAFDDRVTFTDARNPSGRPRGCISSLVFQETAICCRTR